MNITLVQTGIVKTAVLHFGIRMYFLLLRPHPHTVYASDCYLISCSTDSQQLSFTSLFALSTVSSLSYCLCCFSSHSCWHTEHVTNMFCVPAASHRMLCSQPTPSVKHRKWLKKTKKNSSHHPPAVSDKYSHLAFMIFSMMYRCVKSCSCF